MQMDQFWVLVESAGTALGDGSDFDGEARAAALTEQLAALAPEAILDFQECFDRARGAIYRWDVWAAAYLIGGGCSDDSFIDFRAGVIALGRDWYERVHANPDSLAAHPAIRQAAADGIDEALFAEPVNYAAVEAYRRITGDHHAFYDAWGNRAKTTSGTDNTGVDMGEDFDFDDPAEMRRRLPRLADLFYGPADAAGDAGSSG